MWVGRGWKRYFELVYGDGVGMAWNCRYCGLYGIASFLMNGRENCLEQSGRRRYGPRLAKRMTKVGRGLAQSLGLRIGEGS